MPRLIWISGLAALALAGVSTARAEVVDANPAGFQVKQTVEIAAPAAKVWKSLGKIGSWWNSQHTWSQDARNVGLTLTYNGEMWENLPGGGFVHHLRVIYVDPGKKVIFDGTLGPMIYSGASGHLVWVLTEKDGHTTFVQTYYVGGYCPGGLDKLAPAVDGVLGEQLGRLKRYVETGKPSGAP
jgi:uncharacterized protein YndB with AHSA1/START domain